MKKLLIILSGVLVLLMVPMLACGPMAQMQVTPTPTKTPRRIKLLPEASAATSTPTVAIAPVNTPTPEATPTPLPTDTPTPEPSPTDTPTPEPPPTDTPLPPPPPTNTPPPPPPTNTPAPPPPTKPPANQGPQVEVQLPDGNKFHTGEDVKIIFIVRDPDGVKNFTWGIFTQNQVSLKGGEKECNGAKECSKEVKESVPIVGTFIVGADAIDTKGKTSRGVGEIYVN